MALKGLTYMYVSIKSRCYWHSLCFAEAEANVPCIPSQTVHPGAENESRMRKLITQVVTYM